VRQDKELGIHLIDWRAANFSLNPESHSAVTQAYELLSSMRANRTIFGILAGILRLIEQGLSEESVSNEGERE
jgi:hypothetical protein